MTTTRKRAPYRHNALDPLTEGYLSYLLHVGRKAPRTIVDVRCTLRRATDILGRSYPDKALWELPFEPYLRWIEQERAAGTKPSCLAKFASHLRGFLDYAWRSGRCDRNVLDGFNLHDAVPHSVPAFLTEARRAARARLRTRQFR